MTPPTNWPNPEMPGVPLFPERDGWHWISYCGTPRPLFWSAKSNTWFSSSGTRSRRESTNAHWEYISPVLTPTQIAEMLAGERERAAKEAQRVSDKYYLERGKEPIGFARENCIQRMLGAAECAKEIRNLGDTA